MFLFFSCFSFSIHDAGQASWRIYVGIKGAKRCQEEMLAENATALSHLVFVRRVLVKKNCFHHIIQIDGQKNRLNDKFLWVNILVREAVRTNDEDSSKNGAQSKQRLG
jgi:hypothetical protein